MKNNKKLLALLTPSWVVNFIGITAGVLLTLGVVILSHYQGSELQQQIFEVQTNDTASSPTTAAQTIADNLAHNQFLGAAPLLIVWACVGLVVYFFAVSIATSFSRAVELRDELDYVHASRDSLIREALLQLGLRVLATIGWFIFIKLSLSVFVPYAMAAAQVASRGYTLSSLEYALLAVLAIYIMICVHAVFLRLIALKPRVFGN